NYIDGSSRETRLFVYYRRDKSTGIPRWFRCPACLTPYRENGGNAHIAAAQAFRLHRNDAPSRSAFVEAIAAYGIGGSLRYVAGRHAVPARDRKRSIGTRTRAGT